MLNTKHRSITILLLVMGIFVGVPACEKEPNPLEEFSPSKSSPTGKREYGEIKPVVLPLPDGVKNVLNATDVYGEPLKEVNIYFRALTIVGYRDNFNVKDFMTRQAAAFAGLAGDPAFAKEADTWAIQLQERNGGDFITLACDPKTSLEYAKSRNLADFFQNCDYLMINDEIIDDGLKRLEYYDGSIKPPAPRPSEIPQ